MATMRAGLFGEIVSMSIDTLRTSKMRSALTVLGVVIGITSIVGMTALIRGFDESLRDSIRALGPNTVFVQKFSALSFASGKSFLEVAKRPNITREDARAVASGSPSIGVVDVWLGGGGNERSRVYYGHEKTTQIGILGATENFSAVNFIKLELGRLFTSAEVEHRRQVGLDVGAGRERRARERDVLRDGDRLRGIDRIGKLGAEGGGAGDIDARADRPRRARRGQVTHQKVGVDAAAHEGPGPDDLAAARLRLEATRRRAAALTVAAPGGGAQAHQHKYAYPNAHSPRHRGKRRPPAATAQETSLTRAQDRAMDCRNS